MKRLTQWPWSIAVVWLTLPFVGGLVAATLEPIPPHDYWWHLAMGRYIAATGTLPDANMFLYTLPADLPFTNQPWLGQLVMYELYQLFGHAGPVYLRNVLLGGALALVLATAIGRSRDARSTGALGLLAAILAYPVMTVRTRMFAFVPFAVVAWASFGVADGRLSRRWLWAAPVATVCWANMHGSFILGPLIICGVAAGLVVEQLLDDRTVPVDVLKTWTGPSLATIVAGAVGPHGFGAYSYVFQLAVSSPVASSVSEWLPPSVEEGIGLVFLLAVVLTVGLLARARRNVRLYEVFIFAGTLYLSAGAVRSLFWWAAIVPIVVAPHLSERLPLPEEGETSPGAGRFHAAFVVLAGLLLFAVQPGVGRAAIGQATGVGLARQSGPGAWVLNHENAEMAVARIASDDRGRVFHDQALGGMLEYALSRPEGEQVAFVDQRMEFVPDSVWDQYFVVSEGLRWREAVESYGIDTMLLRHDAQWPLVQELLADPAWSVVTVEQSHLLFYRSLDRAENPSKQ